MVKLERSKAIERAIKRAAQAHNFVMMMAQVCSMRCVQNCLPPHNFVMMMAQGRYTVVSGKSEAEYTVKLVKGADGCAWAQCDCAAGKESMVCHHIISAGWLHKAICKMRKA